MTAILRYTAVTAGLVGGILMAAGSFPAAAQSPVPAVAETEREAAIRQIMHLPEQRAGRVVGERYWQQKNVPDEEVKRDFRYRGPSATFGLGVPSQRFGLARPDDRRVGHGAPPRVPGYGRIDR